MKIIRTKLMGLIGKKYFLFFGLLLTAPKARITEVDLNHEAIHNAQMKEMLYLFFYIWYGTEWLVRIFVYTIKWLIAGRKTEYEAWTVYRKVSFEREAYVHEVTKDYLKDRTIFNWWRFL